MEHHYFDATSRLNATLVAAALISRERALIQSPVTPILPTAVWTRVTQDYDQIEQSLRQFEETVWRNSLGAFLTSHASRALVGENAVISVATLRMFGRVVITLQLKGTDGDSVSLCGYETERSQSETTFGASLGLYGIDATATSARRILESATSDFPELRPNAVMFAGVTID